MRRDKIDGDMKSEKRSWEFKDTRGFSIVEDPRYGRPIRSDSVRHLKRTETYDNLPVSRTNHARDAALRALTLIGHNVKTSFLQRLGILAPMIGIRPAAEKMQYTINNMMERKFEDLLFSTTDNIQPEQMNGILCTRANLRRELIRRPLIDNFIQIHDLHRTLMKEGWNSWETSYSGDTTLVLYAVKFDEVKQVFSGWVRFNLIQDDQGYYPATYGGVVDHPDFEHLKEKIEAIRARPNFFTISECSMYGNGHLSHLNTTFDTAKVELGMDVFYPFMKQSLKDYFHGYMESSAPVLILKGPPGTGKSTWLRTLLAMQSKKSYLTYQKECAMSTEFLNAYYGDPLANICVMEDLDSALGSRENGNDWMSVLLNRTEGLVKRKNKKMIITTNLKDENQMEEALRRTGRCYDIVTFRELRHDEAEIVNLSLGRDSFVDMGGQNSITLSDVLNPLQREKQAMRKRPAVGFAPSY